MSPSRVLPSGTVTFLFTDIEGSTRLLERVGDDVYASLLEEHRVVLRDVFDVHDGVEVSTEGDAFFVAFLRAADAVRAAVAGQRALQSRAWADDASVRVRMGIHTGDVLLNDGDYVGATVHRAHRVSALAHGGQILVSGATATVAGEGFDDGTVLRDLGQYQLKDLAEPERIHQVYADGLESEFPPLRSLEQIPNNLPQHLKSFIPRDEEAGDVIKRLQSNRLVTITGSGGSGKTRLALHVAGELLDRYQDGVWLIDYSTISDASLVVRQIARTLGMHEEAMPAPGVLATDPLLERLASSLQTRQMLLIFDNVEHLIEQCSTVISHLTARCARVAVLATSREPMGVEGEIVWRIPSMSLPSPLDLDISTSQAVRLFTDRAELVRTDFVLAPENIQSVVEICTRLDGIPLAIELAAARTKVLTPAQIAKRLDDHLNLLTAGSRTAVERQQTLRASIDWSFRMLGRTEQLLMSRFCVFAGGADFEAVARVCVGDDLEEIEMLDTVASLVDKSLLELVPRESSIRYRMLESIRQYASEKLRDAGEATKMRQRHLEYFATVAERQSLLSNASEHKEFSLRMDALEEEIDNVRAAISFGIAQEAGVRLASAAFEVWLHRTDPTEAIEWLRRALHSSAITSELRGCVLTALGLSEILQDYPGAEDHLREAVALFEGGVGRGSAWTAWAFIELGWCWRNDRNPLRAIAIIERGLELARTNGSRPAIAEGLVVLGKTAELSGEFQRARTCYEEASRLDDDEPFLAWGFFYLAKVCWVEGDYDRSRDCYRSYVDRCRSRRLPGAVVMGLIGLARVEMSQGRNDIARDLLDEALDAARDGAGRSAMNHVFEILGDLEERRENFHASQSAYERCIAISRQLGEVGMAANALFGLASLALRRGDSRKGVELCKDAVAEFQGASRALSGTAVLRLAHALVSNHQPEVAVRCLGAYKSWSERSVSSPVDFDRRMFESDLTVIREQLERHVFEGLWSEGQSMSLEAACRYVLTGGG
ncbi:MAG: ATP-binding protein [Actinomycetota bacterium]